MANVILHQQTNSKPMSGATIKIVDVKDSLVGAIDVRIEFSPAIDNNSPAHRFVGQVVELLQSNKLDLCID